MKTIEDFSVPDTTSSMYYIWYTKRLRQIGSPVFWQRVRTRIIIIPSQPKPGACARTKTASMRSRLMRREAHIEILNLILY